MTEQSRPNEQAREHVQRMADRFLAERGQDVRAEGQCNCDELLDHLFEFLDAELDERERARLSDHVDGCPTCHEAADVEQHVRALIRRSCTEVAPDSLRLRVVSQLTVLRSTGVRSVD